MSTTESCLWGILSAGGEGVRPKGFARICVGTDALKQVCASSGAAYLTEAECLFMDNHFQDLRMAYFRWKRKHTWPAAFH
jgi:hypothetical protein